MAKRGFKMGNHVFLDPSINGPLSRLRAPKKQISGAPAPSYLDGLVREASKKSSAARELLKGKFCGHGEPTMTVYDIVIGEHEVIEISGVMDKRTMQDGDNPALVVVRAPEAGSDWHILFDRSWSDELKMLAGARQRRIKASEKRELEKNKGLARVSIGFEYPCDATSRDDASWLAIDALVEGGPKPGCIVSAEIA